jgi:hypothetical protein
MTAAALKTYIATQLTPPVNQVQSVINSFNEVVDFITAQQQSEVIPNWTALLEFNTDGSGDGSYAIHPDSNGAIRFWKTKTDTNTGNEPPTNPAVTENDFWIEVSPAGGSAIQEWSPGIYGAGLIIVFHNHSTDGPGLYLLAEPVRPYESANIETEITAEDWVKITGGGVGTPETLQRSTNEISYDQDANYGTKASPRTGALTESNTGAKLGVTALIFYDNTTLDVPATWDFHESDDLFIADDPCIIRVEYLSDTYKSASLQPITI